MALLRQDLVETVTKRLVAEFQPEQIWLFGSHAWGTPHEDIDVDLSKDVFVHTRAEFDHYRNVQASLQYRILDRGRKLYG